MHILLRCLLLALLPPAVYAAEDLPPQWDFVVGRYQLIGRAPDSTRTYHGSAKIEHIGKTLRLTRIIERKTQVVHGVVRRADPGEAYVLAFAWKSEAARPMEMVCVIGGDLDNYARLTCHWGIKANPHKQPGMEAYFAQEPWDPIRE